MTHDTIISSIRLNGDELRKSLQELLENLTKKRLTRTISHTRLLKRLIVEAEQTSARRSSICIALDNSIVAAVTANKQAAYIKPLFKKSGM